MYQLSVAYAASLVVFIGLDMIWLMFLARDFYRTQMGNLMAPNIGVGAGIAFYLLFVVGLVIFGVSPGLKDGSWRTALLYSALFGLFCYATYDLTNLAVVRDWPATLSYVDMAWGTVLAGIAGLCGYLVASTYG